MTGPAWTPRLVGALARRLAGAAGGIAGGAGMRGVAICCVAIVAITSNGSAAGCGGDDDEPGSSSVQRGPGRRGGGGDVVAPASPPAAPPDSRSRAVREATRTPQPWGAAPIQVTETVVEGGGAADEPQARAGERDLGRELQQALGAPAECLPPEIARSLAPQLRLAVRVWVTASGRVTRAEVSGSAPVAVRDCVDRRAEALSLRAPVPGAPRDVATELVVDIRPDGTARAAAGSAQPPERRLPPGASAPGITLPAVGAQGRPQGSVTPDLTLPAVGAEGRPEGFVPPSSTLPATAD